MWKITIKQPNDEFEFMFVKDAFKYYLERLCKPIHQFEFILENIEAYGKYGIELMQKMNKQSLILINYDKLINLLESKNDQLIEFELHILKLGVKLSTLIVRDGIIHEIEGRGDKPNCEIIPKKFRL